MSTSRVAVVVVALACAFAVARPGAQDRLRGMPGYDQFTKMQPLSVVAYLFKTTRNIQWAPDGKSFTYTAAAKSYRFDLATMTPAESEAPSATPAGGRAAGGRAGGRAGGGLPPATGGGRSGGMEQEQSEMPVAPMAGCPPIATQTARGRQAYCIESPDQKFKAFYRDRNMWVAKIDGSGERQITKDGSEKSR